ncbi:MAG: hypothetical protein GEU90_00550 [Gemmatimonas sp.]|nr:hypothetical protein [Gemmatimonas sp.]
MQAASGIAAVLDPARLARRAGLDPDPWQRDLLRSSASQTILLCSRQSGKSTTSALLAVEEAAYRSPALILILAPALRQSQELFRKVKALLPVAGDMTIKRETALTLELGNLLTR